jgi:cysteine synthase
MDARPRAESILELVGGTPLLRLRRFVPEDAAVVYAKLEYLNPGASVKDRAALGMIDDAEKAGRLKPGGTIIEPTAGNTGVGLALVGNARGYRVIVVVPDKFVGPKTAVMKILGAEIILTPKSEGMKGAIAKAREIAATIPNSYVPQQFENPSNPHAHERTTAVEIEQQLGATPDAVVLGGGTGGTFTGVARYFKKKRRETLCVLVEPQGSIWGGGTEGLHRVEGIGSIFWPDTLDRSVIDQIETIPDELSFQAVRDLAKLDGVLVAGSSGAAAEAARRVALRLGPGKTVVTLFPDGFERYLGKEPFQDWV